MACVKSNETDKKNIFALTCTSHLIDHDYIVIIWKNLFILLYYFMPVPLRNISSVGFFYVFVQWTLRLLFRSGVANGGFWGAKTPQFFLWNPPDHQKPPCKIITKYFLVKVISWHDLRLAYSFWSSHIHMFYLYSRTC